MGVTDADLYRGLKDPYEVDPGSVVGGVYKVNPEYKKRRDAREKADSAFCKKHTWSATYQKAPCIHCGRVEIVPGSYKWSGSGAFGYLKGETRDPPVGPEVVAKRYNTIFSRVPRPADGWYDLKPEETDNGGELPAEAASSSSGGGGVLSRFVRGRR